MSPNEILGWVASGLVFATFCSRGMVPLRMLAIASNLAFAGYGFGAHLWPIVVLHGAMLPINIVRLRQSSCGGARLADAQASSARGQDVSVLAHQEAQVEPQLQ